MAFMSQNLESVGSEGFSVTENPHRHKLFNWSHKRCVKRMTNVSVSMKDYFFQRDKTLPKYQLDAKDTDWF